MKVSKVASLALAALVAAVVGCPAVYPEIGTRLRTPSRDAAAVLDPPPPDEVRWIRFTGGKVPELTRGGQKWDQVLGSLPDPYAKLMVNGVEILRTSVQSDTLAPTWPDGPRGNFRVEKDAKMRVELWDNNAINDRPIGVRDIGRPTPDELVEGRISVQLEGGGEITFAFEPAHPMFGLGLWFELRNHASFITRVIEGSPAERAQIGAGDEILTVSKKKVVDMSGDQLRSILNAVPSDGLDLEMKRTDGTTYDVAGLKEGPIYPLFSEYGPVE